MYYSVIFLLMFSTCQILRSHSQDCVSRRELQVTLRHVHKVLIAHETSFLQSVRSFRKKLGMLQNSTFKHSSNISTARNSTAAVCPPPKPLANGRMLGRVFRVGHEVHFLCSPGFQLSGPETRECLDSLKWSGEQPTCKTSEAGKKNATSFSSLISGYVQPSRCIELQGLLHCTCQQGYSIYSQDRGLCTDIDECELYQLTQPGRLCMHKCVNTAGSFHCECPTGYSLSRDNRSCQDVDECEKGGHNCTSEQVCVNTYGGHQCVVVECPRFHNASYVKTSPMCDQVNKCPRMPSRVNSYSRITPEPMRCERNPCVQRNKACLQAPLSVNFHYMAVVSNMSTPRVLFRVSTARVLGDTLRFGLLGNQGAGHFTMQRVDRQSGELLLVEPVQGPAMLEADVEMSELEKRTLLGRYVTKVTLFVSPYNF